MSKELPFYGETITFSDEMILFNDLRSNFFLLGMREKEKIKDTLKKVKDKCEESKSLVEYLIALIKETDNLAVKSIDFSIYTLMHYGIDSYDREIFKNNLLENCDITDDDTAIATLYDELGIINPIGEAIEFLIDMNNKTNNLQEMRNAERSGRSQYVNFFSTDLHSAISGEISAGIMNFGMNTIRSLKDAWVDASDKSKINEEISDFISTSGISEELIEAAINPFMRCFNTTIRILCNNNKLTFPFTDSYWNEYDSTMVRVRNYVEFGNIDTAKKMVTEQLQLNPYNTELYIMMYHLSGDKSRNLIRLAAYFNMDLEFEKEIKSEIEDDFYFVEKNISASIAIAENKLNDYKSKYLI